VDLEAAHAEGVRIVDKDVVDADEGYDADAEEGVDKGFELAAMRPKTRKTAVNDSAGYNGFFARQSYLLIAFIAERKMWVLPTTLAHVTTVSEWKTKPALANVASIICYMTLGAA
jgi:hypothetical protein